MLLPFIVLLVVLFWIFFPRTTTTHFHSYINEVHPYSGLNPELFYKFVDQVNQFEQYIKVDARKASENLYGAIDTAKDLGLCTQRQDDGDISEKITEITNRMGLEGETMIEQLVYQKGLRFNPKYLNDTLLYYSYTYGSPNTLG
jgi:hypothetical protein